VIASSGQAAQIAARNGVKKLILTHIRPKSPELLQLLLAEVRRDYAGEVQLGYDLLAIEV
jgi:ribonuclease BN (tRNA processing enzyme)